MELVDRNIELLERMRIEKGKYISVIGKMIKEFRINETNIRKRIGEIMREKYPYMDDKWKTVSLDYDKEIVHMKLDSGGFRVKYTVPFSELDALDGDGLDRFKC